jgi:hypothetical protein
MYSASQSPHNTVAARISRLGLTGQRKALERLVKKDIPDHPGIVPEGGRNEQSKLASKSTNTGSLKREIKLPSVQDLRQWPDIYYENLASMIDLLKTAKQQVEDYSLENKGSKPVLFDQIINSLIKPYSFQEFTSRNTNIKPDRKLAASYLEQEENILTKLLGDEGTEQESNFKQDEEYLIYQARIANTLKTIDKSELNLRLSFINLYLKGSLKQINHEEDPIAKEALFAKTVKFLNTNLVLDLLPSKETAETYIQHLKPVITLLKKINDAVPEPMISDQSGNSILLSGPFLALKPSLVKNIENHCESLMRIDDLSTKSRIELFKDNDLVSILSPILPEQQRIAKTLNITDKTDINFRLALINLYLENNVEEITKDRDKKSKINKFQDTVKLLDAHLPTLGTLKSIKQASEYGELLKSTFKQLKALWELFPENEYPEYLKDGKGSTQRCPSFALKNYLADIVTKEAEKIIETSHLALKTKSEVLNNSDIADIAGEDTIKRLNNHLLVSLLPQKDLSISSRKGNTLYPLNREFFPESVYQFLSENTSKATYDKNILNQVLIQYLAKSINDSSLFFKFLKLIIENTADHFKKFQNTIISSDSQNNDFTDFKTSVLKYLASSTAKTLLPVDALKMTTSLQELMLFNDTEIQESSKAFYLKVLQETTFPNTLCTMLNQLNIYHNFTRLATQKSLPITLQDLNNSLEFSPVMKAIGLKQLEEIFGLESLEVNRASKTIFSKSPIKLNEAEIHTLKTLEEVRTNLLAQKNPLVP